MKRRLIKALLAALLLAGMAAPRTLAAQDPLPTRVVLSDMGQLVGIEKTHYLLAQQPGGTLWGVYDTSGQQLMPYSRANLTYLGYNCFSTSEKKAGDPEAVNTNALLTLDGSLISYAQYGALRVYNHYWAAGWVLEPGTEEDYDYKDVGENPFKIVTCDIFHLGDWALPGTQKAVRPRLCATLTRDEFYAAQAHDKYLAIMDRQKKVTYYDGDFQPIETGFTSISRPALAIRNYTVYDLSGNRVIDGFTGIREVNTAERMLLVGIRTGFSGEKLNGVYTMEGEELMPPIETPIASVTEGYAVLEEDGKFGLYSFAERRQILPCRYDQLITNPNGVDDYVMNGYVAVEVDGKRYYADIYNDGALSEPIDDTGRGFAQYGCVYAWRQEARSVLMAADGFTQTTRHAYLDSRGDGYLLVYQMDSYYGVMTWHGRDVLNTYTKCIVLTDDGKMICDTTRHGYQLLELTQDDRRALPAEP